MVLSMTNSTAQTTDLTGSLNKYSFDLYKEIKTDSENLFLSPLSTYAALLIAYEGAGSSTRNEFKKVLHIDDDAVPENFRSFSANLAKWRDSSNYMNIANAIWIQYDFKIESNYLDNVANKYLSELKPVDFLKKNTASFQINQWVQDKTNGLIKEIISPTDLDDSTRIVISNAIYFIGKWENEFDKQLTKPDIFYSIKEDSTQTGFMNQTEYLKYFENDHFQFVLVPYAGNDKSFGIILPKSRYGIAEIESGMNEGLLDTILNNLSYPEVKLSLPKFKLESGYSMTEPLKRMGLNSAFTPYADFSGITKEKKLFIDEIKHKAYIKINEEKTEAAAATVVIMRTSASRGDFHNQKIFKADHPFVFMILDNKTRGIIFIGRYVKPA
jgi:serpin B